MFYEHSTLLRILESLCLSFEFWNVGDVVNGSLYLFAYRVAHFAKFKFLVMKELIIANFYDDVFLLLHVRSEFIFFSFKFKFVNPSEVKIAIALICKRKQNPEGFWYGCSSRKRTQLCISGAIIKDPVLWFAQSTGWNFK